MGWEKQRPPCPKAWMISLGHCGTEKKPALFSFCRFFLFASTDHLGARNVTVLVDEVEVSPHLLDADLGDLLGLPAFFAAAGHLRARHIAVLVHKVEVSFLLFDTYFRYLLSH